MVSLVPLRREYPGPTEKGTIEMPHSVEVVRKQPDGVWRFVIDDPTGEGLEAMH